MQIQLTNAADRDLEGILEYGIEQFGVEQALEYFARLQVHLAQLVDNPQRYPEVGHISPGYRRSVLGVHSVYFRIEPVRILIVRVLRSQQPGPALAEGERS